MERRSRTPDEDRKRSEKLTMASVVLLLTGIGSLVFSFQEDAKLEDIKSDNGQTASLILPDPSDTELDNARETIIGLLNDNTVRGVDVEEAQQVLGIEASQEILAQEMNDNSLGSRGKRNVEIFAGGVAAAILGASGTFVGMSNMASASDRQKRQSKSAA